MKSNGKFLIFIFILIDLDNSRLVWSVISILLNS